jgi:hypothetical protein
MENNTAKMKTKYEAIDDLLKNILSVNSIFSDAFINDGYYKNISLMQVGRNNRSLQSSKK